MARRLLLLLLLLAICAPTARAAAPAAPDPERDPEVRAWLVAAAGFWRARPGCQGGVGVVRSEWSASPGAWAAATRGGCWIALDPDFYPRPPAQEPTRWAAAMCAVIAHEWGHLLGRPHSADPQSIMAPAVPLNLVPGCPSWPADPAVARPATGPGAPVAKPRKPAKRRRASPRQRRQ